MSELLPKKPDSESQQERVGAELASAIPSPAGRPGSAPATAALILAAGSSSRMGEGRHKLLLPLAGRPVLAHVLDAACASKARPIIVVLGHQATQVRDMAGHWLNRPEIIVLDNPDYREGMSTSLRLGVQWLLDNGYKNYRKIDSAIIMLGDQPLITSHIIDTLIQARHAADKNIVAPLYEGKRGNPVLFAADLFPELMRVTGDEGGRSVVLKHPEQIALVEAGASMAGYDVDTWEAYQQMVDAWQHNP